MRAHGSHLYSIIQRLGQPQVRASDRVGGSFERLNGNPGEVRGDARSMRGTPPCFRPTQAMGWDRPQPEIDRLDLPWLRFTIPTGGVW